MSSLSSRMVFEQFVSKFLEESIGVPSNILEDSKIVYKNILDFLNHNEDFSEILLKDFNLKIGKEVFKDIKVKFVLKESSSITKPILSQFSAAAKVYFDSEKLKLKRQFQDTVLLKITVFIPQDFQKEHLIELFEQEKQLIISTIVHELHHVLQHRVQNQFSYVSQVNYLTFASDFGTNIPAIDKFLYFCYFVDDFENNTRPSQIAAYASLNQIRKKEFSSFLKGNAVYQTLKEVQGFSYERFLEELKQEIKQIDKFLSSSDANFESLSDLQKIQILLKIIFKTIQYTKASQFQQHLEVDHKLNKEAFEIFVKKFVADIKKFESSPHLFFQKKCVQNSEKASKAIKKISKIYDLLQENNEMCTIGALDWDNYQFFKEPKKVVIEEIDETFAKWFEGLFAGK